SAFAFRGTHACDKLHASGGPSMQHFIMVLPEPPGQFTAHAVGIPGLKATAETREKALRQVEHELAEWVRSGRLVCVDVSRDNPLLAWAGWAKDDPDYDSYLEDLRRFRHEENEREQSPDQEPLPPPEHPKR